MMSYPDDVLLIWWTSSMYGFKSTHWGYRDVLWGPKDGNLRISGEGERRRERESRVRILS